MGLVRAAGLAIAAFLALAGTACGERSEPTGALTPLYPVTVQGAGDPVTLDSAPHRVVPVTPAAASIVASLGAQDRVPAGGGADGFPVAAIGRLHPDLVVASPASDSVTLAKAARRADAPVYVAPDNSLREVEQAITEMGLLVDRPLAARQVVHTIAASRRRVATRLAGASPVSAFVDTGFFTGPSDHSLVGDLLRNARGRNVVPTGGTVSAETLLRLDPAVYLAVSTSGTTLADLRADPTARKLRAVREGRFAVLPARLLEPGPQVGDALLLIARTLHPDAFR